MDGSPLVAASQDLPEETGAGPVAAVLTVAQVPLAANEAGEEVLPGEPADALPEQEEASSSHATTETSGSESSDLNMPSNVMLQVPEAPVGFRFLRHRKTSMLHYTKVKSGCIFLCVVDQLGLLTMSQGRFGTTPRFVASARRTFT